MSKPQEVKETVYEHISGGDTWTVTTSEFPEIRRIKKLNTKYPEQVKIICINADGSLLAHVPHKWLVPRPKKQTPANMVNNFKKAR